MEKRLSIPETAKFERVVTVLLGITVLDTAYLSWRSLSLHAGTVVPGTGLCSWTSGIDCDVVLQTPQARAFWVPNAVLGFGFYFGCFLWWTLGRRYFPQLKRHVLTTLTFWLAVAALVTLWFFNLLFRLPALCPFCPWNHVLSWVALFFRVENPRADPDGFEEGENEFTDSVDRVLCRPAVDVAHAVVHHVPARCFHALNPSSRVRQQGCEREAMRASPLRSARYPRCAMCDVRLTVFAPSP